MELGLGLELLSGNGIKKDSRVRRSIYEMEG